MEKGYYIHSEGRTTLGVSKKIDMQLEEFGKFYEMEEREIKVIPRTLLQRVLGLFPTASIARDYESVLNGLDDPKFIYARRFTCDRKYLRFWKEIKKRFPDCKVILEIFTYPYDKDDFGKWNAWPFLIKEKLYRGKLKKYVDRFVTYSDDDVIFGIETIKTTNGVNVAAIPMVEGAYEDHTIRLLGVAYMQQHHGYERVIEGMHRFYEKQTAAKAEWNITLSLVGDGPEKGRYMQLVDKYGLQDRVSFYPVLDGAELEAMYEQSDVALISFGMYKLGIYEKLGALKSRECLAKGMLLASGCEIETLDADYPYAYISPNDASPVDMDGLIRFFETVTMQGDKTENAERIRQFAFDHVDNSTVMRPILNYVEA